MTPQAQARDLIETMMAELLAMTNYADAAHLAAVISGAAHMACRLDAISGDQWDAYSEAAFAHADQLLKTKRKSA